MNELNNECGNGGVGIIGLLGVCFVVMKIVGVIDWSWIWVTAPFWGGFALLAFAVFFLLCLKLLGA